MIRTRCQLKHVDENVRNELDATMTAGRGIIPLLVNLVHRSFCTPGRNLRLHPDDYYHLGSGLGWDERWFGSTIRAGNAFQVDNEGLSFCRSPNGRQFTLADAVQEAKADIVGHAMWEEYQHWAAYSKFFDNLWALPHHLHQPDAAARAAGTTGKAESYFFSPHYNQHHSLAPNTLIGLQPHVSKADVRRCLEQWSTGSMDIDKLSQAFPMEIGTGFMMPTGVLHAPAGVCTYEPQERSDTFQMFQARTGDGWLPRDPKDGNPGLLFKDIPDDKVGNFDYMISLLDWETNVDAHNFFARHKLRPVRDEKRSCEGVEDRWVVFGPVNGHERFSAKELKIQPGCSTTLTDPGASCILFVAGRGKIGPHKCEAPWMFRWNEITHDEFFITAGAANGTVIQNKGNSPLVSLRYFGPKTHGDELPQLPVI